MTSDGFTKGGPSARKKGGSFKILFCYKKGSLVQNKIKIFIFLGFIFLEWGK